MYRLKYTLSVLCCIFYLMLGYNFVNAQCSVNLCELSGMCVGKRCELDANCMPQCICDGECPSATPAPDNCTCVHGFCEEAECMCEAGWTGEHCNETLPTEQPTNITNDPLQPLEHNPCFDNFTERPLSERRCAMGFTCTYGICEENVTVQCLCDPGGWGQVCSYKCCKDCGENGDCFYDRANDEEICNCHSGYTLDGSKCEPIPPLEAPEEPKWYLWVVGVSAVVLLLLLILLILLPYLMWRHRVILIMKVVHYFQGYEDDDDRQWDAFISYRANDNDERFVVHTLMQKLEDELGFKLNVHFRDFELGETIANNILKAIQGSRRTILIITPEFVRSEFTRFEYEKARQEMITKKHRIIPVLLEDVSDVRDTMDQTLKDILSSVTYIEWPTCGTQKKIDKFWKRIELSLPKKKNSDGPDPTRNQVNNMTDPCDVSIVDEPKTCRRPSGLYTTINDSFISDEPGYDVINHDKLDMKSRDNRVSENLNNDVEKQERYLEILNA